MSKITKLVYERKNKLTKIKIPQEGFINIEGGEELYSEIKNTLDFKYPGIITLECSNGFNYQVEIDDEILSEKVSLGKENLLYFHDGIPEITSTCFIKFPWINEEFLEQVNLKSKPWAYFTLRAYLPSIKTAKWRDDSWKLIKKEKSSFELFKKFPIDFGFDSRITDDLKIIENEVKMELDEQGSGFNYLWRIYPYILMAYKGNILIDPFFRSSLHILVKKKLYSCFGRGRQIVSFHDFDAPTIIKLENLIIE